ncbi:MAG: hypothetical protein ACJ77B_00285, partial [Chloroflexota bacterium]
AHTSLDSTRASLDSTKASVATVSTDREAQEKEVADLSAQVAAETSCISLQQKALDEVDRISGLQTTNFNRTATKSVWSTAETARGKAIDAALDAYYKAYSNAFEGRTSAARTWVANGKAAEARMTAQLKIASAELKTVDTAAAEIEKAMDDLADLLGETERACAAVTE